MKLTIDTRLPELIVKKLKNEDIYEADDPIFIAALAEAIEELGIDPEKVLIQPTALLAHHRFSKLYE